MNAITHNLPAPIGAPMQGGFFAGLIKINGETFGLIAAPKATGEFKLSWNDNDKSVPGALHYADGFANTEAMAAAGSELAQTIRALRIDGFDDWYLPSQDELEIGYRAFKPTTDNNARWGRSGINVSAVPSTYPYMADMPAQTLAEAFQADGAEAFEPSWYWTSTQHAALSNDAWTQDFDDGSQISNGKSAAGRARAFRRFKI
ncbi:MAG: DUF1566 domain-containing protein [Pseudomonadota bacterium]